MTTEVVRWLCFTQSYTRSFALDKKTPASKGSFVPGINKNIILYKTSIHIYHLLDPNKSRIKMEHDTGLKLTLIPTDDPNFVEISADDPAIIDVIDLLPAECLPIHFSEEDIDALSKTKCWFHPPSTSTSNDSIYIFFLNLNLLSL